MNFNSSDKPVCAAEKLERFFHSVRQVVAEHGARDDDTLELAGVRPARVVVACVCAWRRIAGCAARCRAEEAQEATQQVGSCAARHGRYLVE